MLKNKPKKQESILKISLIIFVFCFLFISLTTTIQAQTETETNTEIEYPSFWDMTPPSDLAGWIAYVVKILVFLGVLLAVLQIVWAGVKYTSSSVDPSQKQDAKDRLKYAIIGLILLFSFFVILQTMSPGFVNVALKEPAPPKEFEIKMPGVINIPGIGAYAPGIGWISGKGCYLVDSAFRDTSKCSNIDAYVEEIFSKLQRYVKSSKGNLNKKNIRTIITKSCNQGINPNILFAIWSGEQSFRRPEAAMGCGVYGGKNRFPGFEKQIDCSLKCIKKAINNVSPYNKPIGENIFTRLFYSYTETMKQTYQKFGYVADGKNARIIILKILAPEQVECEKD